MPRQVCQPHGAPMVSSLGFCLFLLCPEAGDSQCSGAFPGPRSQGCFICHLQHKHGRFFQHWARLPHCLLAGSFGQACAHRCGRTWEAGCLGPKLVPCLMEGFGYHLCSLSLSTRKRPKCPARWAQSQAFSCVRPDRLCLAHPLPPHCLSPLCSGLRGLVSLTCSTVSSLKGVTTLPLPVSVLQVSSQESPL